MTSVDVYIMERILINYKVVLLCLQMSVATDTKVFVVIMFDRAAKVLFGCSADQFFDFAKTHPYAGKYFFLIISNFV